MLRNFCTNVLIVRIFIILCSKVRKIYGNHENFQYLSIFLFRYFLSNQHSLNGRSTFNHVKRWPFKSNVFFEESGPLILTYFFTMYIIYLFCICLHKIRFYIIIRIRYRFSRYQLISAYLTLDGTNEWLR